MIVFEVKYHIVEPCFKIHSDDFSCLTSIFRSFVLSVVLGIIIFKYTKLFLLFCSLFFIYLSVLFAFRGGYLNIFFFRIAFWLACHVFDYVSLIAYLVAALDIILYVHNITAYWYWHSSVHMKHSNLSPCRSLYPPLLIIKLPCIFPPDTFRTTSDNVIIFASTSKHNFKNRKGRRTVVFSPQFCSPYVLPS